jgi:hypothetical protein
VATSLPAGQTEQIEASPGDKLNQARFSGRRGLPNR